MGATSLLPKACIGGGGGGGDLKVPGIAGFEKGCDFGRVGDESGRTGGGNGNDLFFTSTDGDGGGITGGCLDVVAAVGACGAVEAGGVVARTCGAIFCPVFVSKSCGALFCVADCAAEVTLFTAAIFWFATMVDGSNL